VNSAIAEAPPAARRNVAHRLTIWSLAATAACLPLYVVRWRIGPVPTTLLEVLILITIVAYLATLLTERRLPAARTAYDIPIALLLVAGVIGIIVAPDHTRALGIYRAYFVEAVACFYIAVDLLRTREDLQKVLLIAAAGSCVMAVGQIASFAIVLAQHRLQLGDAPSFLNTSANAVAMYLEPPLAFAVGFTVFASRPKERWIGGGVLALLLIANVLTLSRASYLAMAVLATVLVLSLQSNRWRLRAVGALAVLGLAVLEIPIVNHRLLDLAHSVTNRTTLYRETFEMLSQRPITGAGISGFPVRVAPFRPPNLPIQLYPHDMWLTTWSEIGLLGLLSFAVIFFGLLWRGARALPRATDIYRPVLWGAVGALVLYTVHGLFDSPYWKNDLSVEFWLLAALQVVAVRATRSRDVAGTERPAVPDGTKLRVGDDPRLRGRRDDGERQVKGT
jgi:O-antigen ligase